MIHSTDKLSTFIVFFFNDTATTEIYPLSLHDALPISTYTVTQADLDAGFVTNSATGHASFTPYQGSPTAVDSNQDSTTVNAIQSPALTLAKNPKSTSLNSSHRPIPYSVLFFKNKNINP